MSEMKKIWVVWRDEGYWDRQSKDPLRAFESKADAEDFRDRVAATQKKKEAQMRTLYETDDWGGIEDLRMRDDPYFTEFSWEDVDYTVEPLSFVPVLK